MSTKINKKTRKIQGRRKSRKTLRKSYDYENRQRIDKNRTSTKLKVKSLKIERRQKSTNKQRQLKVDEALRKTTSTKIDEKFAKIERRRNSTKH